MAKKKRTRYDTLRDKAWKLMSELVRRTGTDFSGFGLCCTCPKYAHWKEFHAGHYRHGFQDFNPKNVHRQCNSCNTYHSGRLDVYTLFLVKKYGAEIIHKLDRQVIKERQRIEKTGKAYTEKELEDIITDLKEKIAKL